jgi:FixJ family two-component response regulator
MRSTNSSCLDDRDVSPLPTPSAFLISVVDDDVSFRRAVERLLRSAGFRVQGFGSAEAFLQDRGFHSSACLILDLALPRMSGADLLRQLADQRISIPTVVVTAREESDTRARVLQDGAIAFLTKPFKDDALFGAICSALS